MTSNGHAVHDEEVLPPSYSESEPPPQPPPQEQPQATTPSSPPSAPSSSLFVPVSGPVTAQEYAKMVADWNVAYAAWLQASCAHYGALISGAVAAPLQAAFQINSLNAQATARLTTTSLTTTRQQQQHQGPARIVTIPRASYTIPSLWKRIAAECIDMILLFVLRSIITIVLFRYGFFKTRGDRGVTMERLFSLLVSDLLGDEEDEDELLAQLQQQHGASSTEAVLESTLDDLLHITSQLVIVECIALLFYTVYEVVSLCRPVGIRRVGGATIGKSLMGLKVVQHDISRLRSGALPNTIVVQNAQTLSIWRALLRSTIKNFSASVMFPASLTVFFYSHRLAVYDILAASTVVEAASEHELPLHEHAE